MIACLKSISMKFQENMTVKTVHITELTDCVHISVGGTLGKCRL